LEIALLQAFCVVFEIVKPNDNAKSPNRGIRGIKMSRTGEESGQLNYCFEKQQKYKRYFQRLYRQRYLFLMVLPFLVWVIVFKYIPIWGWTMAFQDYKPHFSFLEQTWVGFKYFIELFHDRQFYLVLRNTLVMSLLSLLCGYTFPIIFAILINEIRHKFFQKTIQTISYLPHFVSWVVVAGIFTKLLAIGGPINQLLLELGLLKEPVLFMAKGEYFWGIVTVADLWKELGWNSIIFLAAIVSIDENLYEAAQMDGANRFRQIWHVTLPGIRMVVFIMLIMSIGNLINIGFERQFLLQNNLVKDYSEVLDLYALTYGIRVARYAYGTAVGIFKSVVSIILLLVANTVVKRFNDGTAVL
jgi:putative aldouronate transport system permease protein